VITVVVAVHAWWCLARRMLAIFGPTSEKRRTFTTSRHLQNFPILLASYISFTVYGRTRYLLECFDGALY
jgi:hypothetical protein